MSETRRCPCRCHDTLEASHNPRGVDLRDPVADVTACTACGDEHRRIVLTDNGESNPYLPPTQYTGEDGG